MFSVKTISFWAAWLTMILCFWLSFLCISGIMNFSFLVIVKNLYSSKSFWLGWFHRWKAVKYVCYFHFHLNLVNFCLLQTRAGIDYESSFGKVRPSDTILKLQRTTPYYKRNRAHVCSFYVRGQCTRGLECPYRHEMPVTGELSQQNIKDRYYGYEKLPFA